MYLQKPCSASQMTLEQAWCPAGAVSLLRDQKSVIYRYAWWPNVVLHFRCWSEAEKKNLDQIFFHKSFFKRTLLESSHLIAHSSHCKTFEGSLKELLSLKNLFVLSCKNAHSGLFSSIFVTNSRLFLRIMVVFYEFRAILFEQKWLEKTSVQKTTCLIWHLQSLENDEDCLEDLAAAWKSGKLTDRDLSNKGHKNKVEPSTFRYGLITFCL